MKSSNNFDGVRLVAALSVLVSHQFWIVGLQQPLTFGPMTLGSLAVLFFFAISGYLVASSWEADPTVWRFAARRFLRIWPAYIVVIVLTSAWIGLTDARPLAETAAWMYVYKHTFLQPFDWAFFPDLRDPRLNPSIWSIPFEVGCYVLFALAAVVLRRWWVAGLLVALATAMVGAGIGVTAFNPSNFQDSVIWVSVGSFFAAGAVWWRFPAVKNLKVFAAALVAGAVVYLTGSQMVGLAIAIPATAIHVGTRSWPLLRSAGRFGDFSYGVYLWGWPVQQVVASTLGVQAGFGVLFAVSLPCVLLLAALSWHLVERRALAAKPSRTTAWPRWATLELGRLGRAPRQPGAFSRSR
jgi:peptidoglycan/LPS O-acetylase OafA/YrhL